MKTRIPLKRWVAEEAKRQCKVPSTIHARISSGHYPTLALERINKRLIYVTNITSVPYVAVPRRQLPADYRHITNGRYFRTVHFPDGPETLIRDAAGRLLRVLRG